MRQMKMGFMKKRGRRKGAGRPRLHARPGLIGKEVPHLRRKEFKSRAVVHVTQRVRPGVPSLRGQGNAEVLLQAFGYAQELLRVVHYSIQGNHLHLIVEADAPGMLSRGMQGLAIRIAKRLNARLKRRGKVFVERFHSHLLASRREVANAVRYVLGNLGRHRGTKERDELSGVLHPPRVWLLRMESG
jgi:putative transposase